MKYNCEDLIFFDDDDDDDGYEIIHSFVVSIGLIITRLDVAAQRRGLENELVGGHG